MRIGRWNVKNPDSKGCMVEVTKEEALALIISLSTQMYRDSSNSGRKEFDTNEGYFSISIDMEDVK